MQVFDEIMRGFRSVFDDGLRKPLRGVTRDSKSAADSLAGLGKSINDINRSADKSIGQFQSSMGKFTDVLKGASAAALALKVFADQGARYNDMARQTVRGTSMIGRTAIDTNNAVRDLHKRGAAIKLWMGGTEADAMKFSANLREEWARTTRDPSAKDSGAMETYEDSMAEVFRAANIGVADSEKFHSLVVAQANLTMSESKSILDHITKAAAEFGVAGPESIDYLVESMAEVNALEADERAKFLRLQVENLAIQKKSTVELGKYVSDIGGRKGSDAFKEYTKIASVTGKSLDQVTSVMRGTNKGDQLKLQTEYLSKFGNLERYRELQTKIKTGVGLKDGEANEMMQIEMRLKPFLDGINLSIDQAVSGMNVIPRLPVDAADKLKGSFENLSGALETTAERASWAEAAIQRASIATTEAAGGDINTTADVARTANAVFDQKSFGVAASALGGLSAGLVWKAVKMIPRLIPTGLSGAAGTAASGAGTAAAAGTTAGTAAGTGAAAGAGRMALKAAPPAALAWAAIDTFIAAKKMTTEEGRKDIRDQTEWKFDDGPMAAIEKLGTAVLRPGQAVAGMLLKQEETMISIGEAIEGHFKTKNAEASFDERSAAYRARRAAKAALKEVSERATGPGVEKASLKEVSERATGPGIEKATDVKVTPTAVREATQQKQKVAQSDVETKTDNTRILQKLADQPNTLPVLAEIRDLLSQVLLNGGSVA